MNSFDVAGTPSRWITVLDALKEVGGSSTTFNYVCGLQPCDRTSGSAAIVGAVEAAKADAVDAIIFVGGLQAIFSSPSATVPIAQTSIAPIILHL